MSTTDSPIETATEQQTPTEGRSKSERLAEYLRQEAADGDAYIKAKFIADDVGLSPKQIGALIVQLQDSVADLEIEKWSYTGATTWRISHRPS
ncbi:DUF7123 family protein [Halorubrum vacuolatum]|uniref:DUF7123 domain-containing protein n=1 Tax=Halorubrum vacuolatum TaxID=63740 RepID=A0A238WB62_HALVU|nr:hypothetical protein [Halorubrum vacuolatum]SNR43825.1 hypothetical protein SAMN06264855_106134 [Halorubrum vacuolatum]